MYMVYHSPTLNFSTGTYVYDFNRTYHYLLQETCSLYFYLVKIYIAMYLEKKRL